MVHVRALHSARGVVQDSFAMDVVAQMHVAEFDNVQHARHASILASLPGGAHTPRVCLSSHAQCDKPPRDHPPLPAGRHVRTHNDSTQTYPC